MSTTAADASTSSMNNLGNTSQAGEPENTPEILSLNELKISLPSDVYDYLANQYVTLDEKSEEHPSKKHRHDNEDNDNHDNNLVEGRSNSSTQTHLDKMLRYLKTSPAETCCRVNLISSSIDEVVQGLDDHFATPYSVENPGECDTQQNKTQSTKMKIASKQTYSVGQHEKLNDLIVIKANPIQTTKSEIHDMYYFNVPPAPPKKSDEYLQLSDLEKRKKKGWPTTHKAIVVDRFCGEAVLRGANVFIKGILCADAGIWNAEEIAVYADLRGPKSKSVPRGLLLDNYSGRCVFLGIGVSCCKRSEYFAQSTGLGVKMIQTAGPSQPSLNGVLVGKMMLQNLPSVVVGKVLDPQKGDVILDMCCAPGGKTSHLASLIRNQGYIIACDKSRKKMSAARDFFQSMGATCIVPLALDSTKSLLGSDDAQNWRGPKEIIDTATSSKKDGLLDVKGFYPDSFDRILLDPPCSALGLRPKLLVDAQSLPDVMKHAEYQRQFVRNAVPMLKSGGTMTFSTCTINADENEKMVKFILSEFPDMKLVPIPSELPGLPGLPGMGLTDEERNMVRRFDPSDKADTMGFFVALFVKKA